MVGAGAAVSSQVACLVLQPWCMVVLVASSWCTHAVLVPQPWCRVCAGVSTRGAYVVGTTVVLQPWVHDELMMSSRRWGSGCAGREQHAGIMQALDVHEAAGGRACLHKHGRVREAKAGKTKVRGKQIQA